MYIGPQGIVHGTFNTILNAGRMKLGIPVDGDLSGKLFVTSGLGGMSGAQGKAAEIANCVAIIAEVDYSRIKTRLDQGWISGVSDSIPEVIKMAQDSMAAKEGKAYAYHGNIVDLLEYIAEHVIMYMTAVIVRKALPSKNVLKCWLKILLNSMVLLMKL